jgi:hypothetical protein
MVKNYTSKFISDKLNSQLSFDFNSIPQSNNNDVPSEMCIQNILGFSAALEIKSSEIGKPIFLLNN